MLVPQLILRQLYTNGSLQNTDDGIQFSLKNRLATVREIASLNGDVRSMVPDNVAKALYERLGGKGKSPFEIPSSLRD